MCGNIEGPMENRITGMAQHIGRIHLGAINGFDP